MEVKRFSREIKLALLQRIMSTTIYQQRFIQKRKEQGLCLKCGNPLDREGAYCISCNKYLNEQQTLLRYWYQEHGICPRCGKNDLFGDEKVCLECNAKSYEVTMKSRERLGKEHYSQKHSEWARNEHQRRISEGICTRCGKRKADGGYKTCGICRAKTRNYKRIKYGKPERSERYEQGLCYFCDNPIKEGYKVCEKHYQMNIEKLDNEKCRKATEDIKSDMKKYFVGGRK